MSAPHILRRKKRRPEQIRRVVVRGKEFRDQAYKPQFALGMFCADEAEQRRLHRQLSSFLPGREIKVLVI